MLVRGEGRGSDECWGAGKGCSEGRGGGSDER